MRAFPFVLMASIAVAGCQTKLPSEMSHTEAKQLAAEIYQRCIDQNVIPGSSEMDVCTKHEARRDIDKRFANREMISGIGKGIQNAGNNYSRNNQRKPVICRGVVSGPYVQTTCN